MNASPAPAAALRATRAAGLLLALALLPGPARAGAALRIELPAEVLVGPGSIRLGDLVRIEGAEPERARLEALVVGPAPQAGERTRLQRRTLERWVRARTGLAAGRIAWAGAASCQVRLRTRLLAGEALAERAAQAVRQELEERGLRARVAAVATPGDLDVPDGEVAYGLHPLAPEAPLARRLSAWLEVRVAGAAPRTVPVTLDLVATGPALVARGAMGSGASLDASQLEEREVEWSGLPSLPLEASALAGGLRLRQALEAGQVVARVAVEPAPQVARGGAATVHVTQGLVRLEGAVEVLEDGFSGQTVRVKVSGGLGPIAARVTGPGTVEVSP